MKSVGHKVSNELWGGMLASMLSDRQPLEFFLESIAKKCKNGQFFAFSQIKWDFATASYIQGTTMWKLTSWPFRKCRTYWDLKFLNGSYWWSKSEDSEILAPLAKISGRKKKVTLTISKIKSRHRISLETTLFHLRWFNMKPQFCFLNAWLFFYGVIPGKFFLQIWVDFDSK